MFLLDKPYVSATLAKTLADNDFPVLDSPMAREAANLHGRKLRLLPDAEFRRLAMANGARVYANSENAIDWIAANLDQGPLPRQIALFKDKAAFRDLIRPLYPDYRYLSASLDDLPRLDPTALPFPLVVKPAVGFFSLGVHVANDAEQWNEALRAIRNECEDIASLYPSQVLDTNRYIVESCIEGREFAVDAFFDAEGKVAITNILEHLFASAEDVSDRVYYTSRALVREWLPRMSDLLRQMGELAGLRNFPMHVELRDDPRSGLAFIEVNPMRFAGWCVADLALAAFGLNPYEQYMSGRAPDWDALLAEPEDKATAVVVADFPSGVDRAGIRSVDYDAFLARFSKPLELRRVDFNKQPVFAFLFVETPASDMRELRDALSADMRQYLRFE